MRIVGFEPIKQSFAARPSSSSVYVFQFHHIRIFPSFILNFI
uniref:Uncharacterized protein n=1 Tax=Glaucocystis incrassata TaxID=1789788 RepID=A0A3G1IVQ7_9EUKA|nr:hypothetical protein [Glaucocystis incrassata]ASQ40111.1 hypothetical protein [Glaucocystis incrassata]